MAVALPIIAIVATVASTAVSVASSVQASKAQQKSAKFNAAVARNNALQTQMSSRAEAQRIRERNRRLAGKQRAGYSKAGVDVSFGTPQDVMFDSDVQGELDALNAIYTGRTGANNQMARSILFSAEAQAAKNALPLSVAGTIAGGVGQAASIASYSYGPSAGTGGGGSGVTIQ